MDESTRDEILAGIATILWGDAWANHVEEHDCCNLSGCEITDYMPAIPALAHDYAERIAVSVEGASEVSLETLYQRSLDACGVKCPYGKPNNASHTPERFGECLAWESMGAGVSWEDDHNAIPGLVVPHFDDCEIRYHADETCTDVTDRRPCPYCGFPYLDPTWQSCNANCGKIVKWVDGEPKKTRQPKASKVHHA